jgi:hypothetical protein
VSKTIPLTPVQVELLRQCRYRAELEQREIDRLKRQSLERGQEALDVILGDEKVNHSTHNVRLSADGASLVIEPKDKT